MEFLVCHREFFWHVYATFNVGPAAKVYNASSSSIF